MSDTQKTLYAHFVESQYNENGKEGESEKMASTSLSQQFYVRRLLLNSRCVLSAEHPLRRRIAEHLQSDSLSLHSLSIAPKLVALLGLLRRVD